MRVKESHKSDDAGDDVGDFFMEMVMICIVKVRVNLTACAGAGSNDSWQGHRLRRGDGRTPSEQVRQSDRSERKK